MSHTSSNPTRLRRDLVMVLVLAVAAATGVASPAMAGTLVLVDDSASVNAGSSVAIPVLANDTISSPPVTVTLGDPDQGTAVVLGDNTVRYTADPSALGVDEFDYTVTDDDGVTQSAVISVTAEHPQMITSSGPLTRVRTTQDLNCDVRHLGDAEGAFYGDTACGTFAVIDDEMYSPAAVPAGNAGHAWTPVSQEKSGAGTQANPYTIVTTVGAGSTGVRLRQTDTYVAGQESFRTDVRLLNDGTARTVRLYRAADCYLQDSDNGYGRLDANGAVSCTSATPGSNRVIQWQPLTAGSHRYESGYSQVWNVITARDAFDGTCRCEELIDNGAGLSWDVDLAANGESVRSSLITFSPTGALPMNTTMVADPGSVQPGAPVSYTVTVDNPGATASGLSELRVTLPAGFGYVAGSSSGLSSSNPSVSGQTLTWAVTQGVPAGGSRTLTFRANSSTTPGTYSASAGGTSPDVFVNGSGSTAPVTVASVTDEPPRPVSGLAATAGDGKVDLSWVNPTDADLDRIRVFYTEGAEAPAYGGGTEVDLSSPTATQVSVTGLTNGTTYSFAVFAIDQADQHSEAATASAVPVAEPSAGVDPVDNLQAAGAGSGRIRLTWDNPADLSGIVVRYSTVDFPADPTEGVGVPVSGTPTSVLVEGLSDETPYFFSVFATKGAQTSAPTSVQLAPYGCPDLRGALSSPAGLIASATWVACSAPDANSGDNTQDTTSPRTGAQALMTSGDRASAAVGSGGDGRDNGTGSRGAYDVSIYKVDLDVPVGAQCLSFDYAFGSYEYPEYVGQAYNDGFLAQLDTNQWEVVNSAITATGNFAKTADGSYISVNSPVFADASSVVTSPQNGSGYDGMSQGLRASTPVTPGQHSMYLSVFDAGDGVLDSGVFLDNLRTSGSPCAAGTSVNHPPVAVDDTATTAAGTAKAIGVVANDTDSDGDSLTVSSHTDPAHGTVTCTSTTCTYTPTAGYAGADTFDYVVGDGRGGHDTGTVNLTITPANRRPDAVDDAAAATAGVSKTINVLVNDTDPDGDTLTIASRTNPSHGTVSCAATSCSYKATSTWVGADSFTYTISDGHGGTDTATVTVDVSNASAISTVSIATSTTTEQWPAMVTVSGTARKANGAAATGRYVELWGTPAGGPPAKLATVQSNSVTGKLSKAVRIPKQTTFYWKVAETGVTSPSRTVDVRPRVTISANTADLPYNRSYVVSGVASPVRAGAPVWLQERASNGTWSTVQSSTFPSASSSTTSGAPYSFTRVMDVLGTHTYRVVVPADDGRVESISGSKVVKVYRANVAAFQATTPEFITIRNIGTLSFSTSGWQVRTAAGRVGTVPTVTVAPNATVKIYTGFGTNTSTRVYLRKSAMFGDLHDDVSVWDGPYEVTRHQY